MLETHLAGHRVSSVGLSLYFWFSIAGFLAALATYAGSTCGLRNIAMETALWQLLMTPAAFNHIPLIAM
jgi:hypothetical protein